MLKQSVIESSIGAISFRTGHRQAKVRTNFLRTRLTLEPPAPNDAAPKSYLCRMTRPLYVLLVFLCLVLLAGCRAAGCGCPMY